MRTLAVSITATLGGALVIAAALLWPKAPAEAQVGLPVGVADCSCTRGTQIDAGASRVFVHICQCGSMQCVITAGTTGTAGTGSAVPQLAQTCR